LIRTGNTSHRRRRGSYEYDDDVGGYSNDDDGTEDFGGDTDSLKAYAMKLASRDKEDLRVDKALKRIRRAQIMGRKRVDLSPQELEALERRRIQSASLRGSPRNKGPNRPALDMSPRDRQRLSITSSPKANIEAKRVSQEVYTSSSQAPESVPRYPPANRRSSASSQPRSRATSIQSLSVPPQMTPPRSQYQQPSYHQSRALQIPDGPTSSRPSSRSQHLPRSDLQWMSHPVSNSNVNPFPMPQIPYPPYAATPVVPLDPRYVGHHTIPGQSDVHYQPVYRPVSNEFYPSQAPSDPFTAQRVSGQQTSRRYRTSSGSSSSDGAVRPDTGKHSTAATGYDARIGSSGSADRVSRPRTSRR